MLSACWQLSQPTIPANREAFAAIGCLRSQPPKANVQLPPTDGGSEALTAPEIDRFTRSLEPLTGPNLSISGGSVHLSTPV